MMDETSAGQRAIGMLPVNLIKNNFSFEDQK